MNNTQNTKQTRKMTPADWACAKTYYCTGQMSANQIAAHFSIPKNTVCTRLRREAWKSARNTASKEVAEMADKKIAEFKAITEQELEQKKGVFLSAASKVLNNAMADLDRLGNPAKSKLDLGVTVGILKDAVAAGKSVYSLGEQQQKTLVNIQTLNMLKLLPDAVVDANGVVVESPALPETIDV